MRNRGQKTERNILPASAVAVTAAADVFFGGTEKGACGRRTWQATVTIAVVGQTDFIFDVIY